ncbi:DUF6279 family lipoprotein [Pseudoalteromonas shioyasakiensis]|uniref:DUF6279 family lipoprotein n=1 Tax=Pseudoalteromonas shioyasakiensis TaxID=1190813 RepID=UPI002119AEFB|nr:DUF6279 family lipoprotein [Pseudoalteromonas shioyasakiensis]MCQ8878519.1 DUF6279 family lipoprotein [Pseudoalteromonas shioyasakiensis]
MFKNNNKFNLKAGLLVVLTLLLSGCSASFTYNNIGWLSGFWIDDYVDLNKQQEQTVKNLIKETRDWHRKTQLPLYKADLIKLQQLLAGSPSKAQLISHFTISKGHWQTLVNKIANPVIEIASSLDAEQRQQFIAAISETMREEQQEYEQQSEQKRKAERLEEQIERYEEWLGKLSQQQVTLITVANNNHISSFKLWQQYKQTRLDALTVAFSDQAITAGEFAQSMARIITQRQAFMSAELIHIDQQNLALYANLLVELRGSLTAKQINHANEKFAQMIEQIDDLLTD